MRKKLYVVDTGTMDVYVMAVNEIEAGEKVYALNGEKPIVDVEFYSDDATDCPYPEDLVT